MAIGSLYAPVVGAKPTFNSAWESAAEAAVEATLPVLPGLAEAVTTNQQVAVLCAAVEEQRKAFVKIHGDAFGCERRESQRGTTVDPCAANLALQGGVKGADTAGVLYGG